MELKFEKTHFSEEKHISKTTREKIEKTYTEEIIIGLCTPIGTQKNKVIQEIQKNLRTVWL